MSRTVEVHVYEGRSLVTSEWPPRWGHDVEIDPTDSTGLGERVQAALDRVPADEWHTRGSTGDHDDEVERFVTQVIGLRQRSDYIPEIRVVIQEYDAGATAALSSFASTNPEYFELETRFPSGFLKIRQYRGRLHPNDGVELALPASASDVGAAVLAVLQQATPIGRTLASVGIVITNLGLVIESSFVQWASYAARPFTLIRNQLDDDELGSLISAALDASEARQEKDELWRVAFRDAIGEDYDDVSRIKLVGARRTSLGTTEIDGSAPAPMGAFVSVPEVHEVLFAPDSHALGAAVRNALARVPARSGAGAWSARPLTTFGYKTAWLAIRSDTVSKVRNGLGLVDIEESDWPEGLDHARSEGVFVTPAVKGWVLAVGTDLLLRPPDVAALSAALGTEVQYFATHRVSESHRWERANDGRVTRRFEYSGDSGATTHEGRATAVEKRLGIDRFSKQFSAGDFDDIERPSEQTVLEVAGAWSLNPTTLDELPIERRPGTWGSRR